MKRRDALKTIGGLAGAATLMNALPGCSDDDGGPVGITTYVYMMMENRSYDHVFGARKLLEGKAGDGLVATMANPDMGGMSIPVYQAPNDALCDVDPPHGWDAGRIQLGARANDGFVVAHQMTEHGGHGPLATEPMKFLTREHQPVSYAIADAYATADRWHCSVLGPTWPNRFYWHVGTSRGIKSNELPTGAGGVPGPSIYHRLAEKGVDWAYYYGSIPVVSLVSDLDIEGHVRRMKDFFEDAKAGKLPPVVYIDPAFFENDDHPPLHPIYGQELIASIYKALAASPQWKNIMFVVTYDEGGGYYDHVAPPNDAADEYAAEGFNQLGFRVPTMVMGPYVKEGYVSSVRYDHTSALKQLEVAFGLDPLSARTTGANDLSDFIDMERLAKGDWRKPVEIPDVDVTQWDMAHCEGVERVAHAHPVLELADQRPELFAGLDLRDELPEYKKAIRDFLAEDRDRVRRRS